MMKDHKATRMLVQSFYDAMDRADRNAMFALLDPDFSATVQGSGNRLDADRYWKFIDIIRGSLSDFIHRCEDFAIDGNRVAIRGKLIAKAISGEGEDQRERFINVPFLTMVNLKADKIVDLFALIDTMALDTQLKAS